MIKFYRAVVGIAFLTLTGSAADPLTATNQFYISSFENVLGTSLEIKIRAVSGAQAEFAETAALNEIDRLEKILSTYDKDSEVSQWLRSEGAVRVSPELFEVLDLFDKWRQRTNGALDASAEAVSRVWKNASVRQQVPSAAELNQAITMVKQAHWKLDHTNHTATHLDNTPLVFNSFTKSYIINRAAEAASNTANVSAVVVNIGGDMVIRGALTEPVKISDPTADAENDAPLTGLLIHNKAVATSGNYRRGVQIGDRWYSHIIDPRSGQPADQIISATVVAPHASDAGALATAFNVLNPEESIKLLSSIPDAEALIITRDGKRIQSKGWSKLESSEFKTAKTVPPTVRTEKVKAGTWNTNYELAINIEIAKIEGARIHSPFIAVWVEDENKNPVRNIAVWYNKPKWLPDLRSWNRSNGSTFADPAKMGSISGATRAAGKYTLKWDGKNDKGALVKAGKYTVFIEAAREHGTHQLMSSEMNFTGSAKQINLPGNVEIASASLDYRKKSNSAR